MTQKPFHYPDPVPEYSGGNPNNNALSQSSSVPPALTEEQWREVGPDRDHSPLVGRLFFAERYAEVIAIANAALPSSDRRKLNWDYVEKVRQIGQGTMKRATFEASVAELPDDEELVLALTADGAALLALADILASYLPPRTESNG